MKLVDIDVSNIKTLQEFYSLLDEHALYLAKEHEVTDLLLKFKSQTTSDEDKQKVQWEVEASLYSFFGKRVFSFSTGNGSTGEIAEYPTLDEYQKEAFEYLKTRAQTCTSIFLKARYHHLLWSSIVKNTSFAKEASQNYIETINQCNSNEVSSREFSFFVAQLFENLIGLISESKVNVDTTKAMAKTLLFNSPYLNFWAKHGIIEDMLKHPKIFKPVDFDSVLSIFEEHLTEPKRRTDDFQLVNFHLPTAIKVAQKTKADVRRWHNEIGEAYLRLAESETDQKRAWIKLDYYRHAIDAFRKGGNAENKRQTEQKYFELKPLVKLDEIRIDFDEETIEQLKAFQEGLKQKARNLLKNKAEVIYAAIASGSFFPKYQDVVIATENKKSSFLDFATTLQFDRNKNIKQKAAGENNRENILEAYGMRMTETLLPFLHYVIVFGIKSGHLTIRNFLQYLTQNTWIGQPHTKIDLGGNPRQSNWIFQISPAIAEFFNQVLAWGESKYYTPNFIVCTDSLTLKLEGLFRNFSERLGVSVSIGKGGGVQEVLAHDVFNNEMIRKYFNEEDMLLFDYVFAKEGGLNLRNNIAHCFYNENEYTVDFMLLLIAVLLRLGKYKIKTRAASR